MRRLTRALAFLHQRQALLPQPRPPGLPGLVGVHIGKDIMAGLRTLVGGEIKEYTKMLAEAREQEMDRMIEDAKSKDADAIVGFRFVTSPVMQGAAELVAYGTAV